MQVSDVKIGQTVWFYENWTNAIESAIVMDIVTNSDAVYTTLHCQNSTCNRVLDDIYPSHQLCKEAVDLRNRKTVDAYRSEITDKEALINFALTHNVGPAEEYTDYNARMAFVIRAKELLGVTNISNII